MLTTKSLPFFFFFEDFIYLTERDTVREGTQAEGVGEGEAGFPRTLGPWQTDAQRLSHPGQGFISYLVPCPTGQQASSAHPDNSEPK